MSHASYPARVCVIGAGPAGMSCALWLHNLGMEPTLIDNGKAPGGAMLLNFLNNNWVLGHSGMSGLEMAAHFTQHITSLNVPMLMESRPTQITRASNGEFLVSIDTPQGLSSVEAEAVVLATGTRFRGREILIGLPGFAQCDPGRLRFGPHCFTRMSALAGKHVLIIGGGDNALENALMALEAGARVTLVARNQFHGQAQFIASLQRSAQCALHADAHLTALQAAGDGLRATLEGAAGNWQIEVDRVHLLAGYTPNTAFLAGLFGSELKTPHVDERGYLICDAQGRSSTPGIYVAGDVGNPAFPNVLSALAQGAQVAKSIESDLKPTPRS